MQPLFSVTLIASLVANLALLTMPAAGQPPAANDAPGPGTSLPTGVIVMWSGPLDAIPAGWALCDGRNGTPDLRNRFVLGVGAAEYLGSTGGSRTHQHRAQNHNHRIDPPALRGRPAYGYSGYGGTGRRGGYYMLPEQTVKPRPFKSDPAASKPESVSHLPPYYKIAFIMKL